MVTEKLCCSQMDMDDFRPVTTGSSYIIAGCGCFGVIEDGSA